MEYILHIVLALVTVGAADAGLESGTPRPVLVAALLLVPHVLALVARSAQYHGRFRSATLLERVLILCPLALQVLSVTYLGWLGTVGEWIGVKPSLASWPGLELLAGIAPFLAFELAALHARTLLRNPRISNRNALFLFQARMLLSGLAPFALYVLLSAALGHSEGMRVRLEEVSLYNTLFTLALLGGFLAVLPFLLRSTWSTSRMPAGDLRVMLEEVADRSGFAYRELLRWNTGGQMANAAIVGITPRTRVVLFTDALMEQLNPRELAAVFAHEIGHARRRHALTFGLFILIVFVGGQLLLEWTAIESEWVALGAFAGLLGLWLVAFGYLSRRFELDADLSSLEVLGDPLPLVSALLRVTGVQAQERDGWRHFSTGRRVRFLLAAAEDPALGLRLRRNLGRWTRVAAVVAMVLVLVWCQRLFALRPAEELVVDLRLGHWGAAAERMDELTDVDGDLALLVERAQRLPEGLGAEELEQLALEAAQTRDFAAARDLLELARLRGAPDTEARLELLGDLLAPDAAQRAGQTGSRGEGLDDERRRELRGILEAPWDRALQGQPAGNPADSGFGLLRRGAILRR